LIETILILPALAARSIESVNDWVVVEYGMSRMTMVLVVDFFDFRPAADPAIAVLVVGDIDESLLLEVGIATKSSLRRIFFWASSNSQKLCGRILVAIPTAMPSDP